MSSDWDVGLWESDGLRVLRVLPGIFGGAPRSPYPVKSTETQSKLWPGSFLAHINSRVGGGGRVHG